jgi:hypothetical protein
VAQAVRQWHEGSVQRILHTQPKGPDVPRHLHHVEIYWAGLELETHAIIPSFVKTFNVFFMYLQQHPHTRGR